MWATMPMFKISGGILTGMSVINKVSLPSELSSPRGLLLLTGEYEQRNPLHIELKIRYAI